GKTERRLRKCHYFPVRKNTYSNRKTASSASSKSLPSYHKHSRCARELTTPLRFATTSASSKRSKLRWRKSVAKSNRPKFWTTPFGNWSRRQSPPKARSSTSSKRQV